MFSTIQIVRFTSPSPPPLASSTGTNNIQDCDVDAYSAHQSQPGYIFELIVDYQPVYKLRSANNNLLVIPRTKTEIASRLSGSLHQSYGTVCLSFHHHICLSVSLFIFHHHICLSVSLSIFSPSYLSVYQYVYLLTIISVC